LKGHGEIHTLWGGEKDRQKRNRAKESNFQSLNGHQIRARLWLDGPIDTSKLRQAPWKKEIKTTHLPTRGVGGEKTPLKTGDQEFKKEETHPAHAKKILNL